MLNVAAIMGRLTYDPELKATPSGVSVCHFTVACDRSYARQGEERKTDFINVTAWRQTAEFVSRYFHKGSMIAVDGSIAVENYTDRDGNKRTDVHIVANNVSFCGPKSDNNNYQQSAPQERPSYSTDGGSDFDDIVDDDDEELPF